MKIHGVEGMSPEMIRDEVNRGGRMVIYTYCVSLVVLTLKRPTAVYFIRPGASGAVAGWPFILVSFLFGWWGIPWGPIYTIQTIYKNLCGGIDVTDDIVHSLLPAGAAPAAGAPPPLPQTGGATAAPQGFNFRVAVLMIATVGVAVFLGIGGYCYYKQTHMTVVLVSGLAEPYSVLLNGEQRTLEPYGSEILTMREGEFILQDAAGSDVVGEPQTFTGSIAFFDHLKSEKLVIINPDQVAVLINAEIPYYTDGATIPENEEPGFTMLVNERFYFIDRPDFVIEEAAQRIDMPSGTTRLVKRRLQNLPDPDLAWAFTNVIEKTGYPAARELAFRLAEHRTDEDLLRAAFIALKPEDAPAFFKLHLDDQPVLVEWHRYYQQRMTMLLPGHDLVGEYRARLASDPENGAYCYLLGRLLSDHVEQSGLWQRALAAKHPCYNAFNALAFDAMAACDFEKAVAFYDESLNAGLSGGALTHYRRQALIAAGRVSDALAEIAAERQTKPLDLALAEEEIVVSFAAAHDAGAIAGMRDEFLASFKKLRPPADYLRNAEAVLGAAVAYLTGDDTEYLKHLSLLPYPFYQFRAAVATGDTATAARLSSESFDDTDAQFLLYIVATRAGNQDAADAHFSVAQESMSRGSPDQRVVAAMLASGRPDAAAVCAARIDAESKRILLAALGTRFNADRDAYFAVARKLNFNPQFPHRLLAAAMGE